jgi:SPP1 family predicted phage head-tail adaptor
MAALTAAGKFNQFVTIQSRSTSVDAAGQPVEAWNDVLSTWAFIAGDNGMNTIRRSAEGVGSEVKRYSFRIRFREGLDETMRVSYAGRYFDIRAVRMDFAGRDWTDLVCEDSNNGG